MRDNPGLDISLEARKICRFPETGKKKKKSKKKKLKTSSRNVESEIKEA